MEAMKRDRGMVRIDGNECKGCGLCVEACPPNHPNDKDPSLGTPGKVLRLSEELNHYGYRTAMYAGAGCTGCGICFMACPEPGAITVYRLVVAAASGRGRVIPMRGADQCESN